MGILIKQMAVPIISLIVLIACIVLRSPYVEHAGMLVLVSCIVVAVTEIRRNVL